MQVDKAQIIDFLEHRGEQHAERARQHLPNTVDTDQQAGLLAQHGVSVEELLSTIGGDLGPSR